MWVSAWKLMKRVKAKVFIQDPFNPVLFTDDAERFFDVCNIVCTLTSHNYREDILELEEGISFISMMVFNIPMKSSLLQRQLRHLRWQNLQPMKYNMNRFQGEERGSLKAIFFQLWIGGNTSKQIWGTMTNIFEDQGNSANIFGIRWTGA